MDLRNPKTLTTPERINGALFDFASFLTTLPEAVVIGRDMEAPVMIDLLERWAKNRGWDMTSADVANWDQGLGLLGLKEASSDGQ